MAQRVRRHDWSRTPLGPMEHWPESLRLAVGICLHSRFPMFVWWGPHLINIYNDAYIPVLGRRHPDALGRPAREVWAEIWDIIGPQADAVMQRGEATWNDRVLLVMERNGYAEETYFTWSYSAIPGPADGTISGLFCVCTEETQRMRAERERDRLEAALRESEDHYRHTVELSSQIPWTAGTDGRLLDFSEKWTTLLGVSREQGLTDSVSKIHPDDLNEVIDRWTHTITTGDPHDVEYRIHTADGEYRWMRSRAYPRRDADGKIVRWYGTTEDIHERKASERAAREAEHRYRAVFESTRDAMIIYDPDGRVRQVNPSACRLYGFAPEEIVGVNARDVMHPAALPLFDEFRRVTSSGGEFRCETVDRRKDGTAFPIEVVGTSFTDNGRLQLMSAIRDITDRKRTVDRISRLYAVAAALSEAMTTADVARITVEQGIAALGASAGSLALLSEDGLYLEMAGSVGYPEGVIARWQRTPIDAPIALTDAVRKRIPILLRTPEERLEKYPALAAVTPVVPTLSSACIPLLAGGRAIGVLGLSFDRPNAITPEDQEFSLSFSRQCAQAIERARLFEAERRARADAEAASRSKDEFLATLSHELRTPLNAILGWSQIVRSGPGDADDVAQGIEVIERNARAQSQIIDDLLDMNRIISGKVHLDLRPIDLAAVLQAAIHTAQPTASAKTIRLEARLGSAPVAVLGDGNRLQQVLWNLLSNAIKFTPRSGHIEVLLSRSEADAKIVVSDTGEGIDESFLPHVFDRFRQADATTTRRHGGLGLGLAIARQLVELHGGTISAHSEGIGRGSTFTVTLPLASARSSDNALATSGTSTLGEATLDIAGVRVLVVDDEADARALLKRLLEDRLAIVTTASSAAEALERLRAEPPHVLVSDIGMPHEDGYTLIRQVRALAAEAGGLVPAIAVTAYARSEDRAMAVSSGFQHHLAKPIEPDALIAAVAGVARR